MRLLLFLFLVTRLIAAPEPLQPGHVLVVYNSNSEDSKELAEFYSLMRKIPPAQIVGVPTTEKATIDLATYNKTIRDPLRKQFTDSEWWTLSKDTNGILVPSDCHIRCIVLMRGMPLRISRSEASPDDLKRVKQAGKNTESSIDSELTLFGVDPYPLGGFIPNPYFQKDLPFIQSNLSLMFLVGRLDGPTQDHCKRMVLDSLDVEEKGLWGRAYVDHALKGGGYAIGDEWMSTIVEKNLEVGIPTVVDRQKNTFTSHYPMTDAALYFGWYTFHRNGPFLNPAMKFKQGAVAVHLHSFSAEQLNNPAKNWSAALIDRGAAATLGNVWEPYLGASHDFGTFHDRLLKGYSLIESGYMAINVLSWQAVVIGDPLYRPYKNFATVPSDFKEDRDYKAIRLAHSRWEDQDERRTNLTEVSKKFRTGVIQEHFGMQSLEAEDYAAAAESFKLAKKLFKEPADQLRQDLNLVELYRRQEKRGEALAILKKAQAEFKDLPEVKSVDGLITILDPPAPPPTKKK
ncbi:TIGR03790 family protein [Akkermansiaceae bacterium]|nr:TIGR03790 family protein [Akkermansiaceae bacterium]